jgi:NADH/NAD ratio-sensing transcriptional regulator Rex
MDNVIRFRPRRVPREIHETEPADIDDILDYARGRLTNLVLIGMDDEGHGIVATYPGSLHKDEVTELFDIVQQLVFGYEQHS